jgi:hypothetical protein
MSSELNAYHELCGYTLTHGDLTFIHQHVVDAHAAQCADETTKAIGLTFALAGLYLHVEKGFSGRQVQRAHMQMARRKRQWPAFPLPGQRGSITALDVLAFAEGVERDSAIDDWCRSVWAAYAASRPTVVNLLGEYGIV